MKKFILLLAVAGMFVVSSCNSAPKTEVAAGDSTAVSTTVDTTVVTTTTTTVADTTKK